MAKDNKEKKTHGSHRSVDDMGLCDLMNFTTAESFKMLRTKLNLTMPQGENSQTCRIIGVTSSLRGEGKTHTSVNLAYTFAEANKRVCLVEGDMRLPNISKRLSLEAAPGLSNLLTGQDNDINVIQHYTSPKGVKFDVLTSGDIPPMPSELLESKNMRMTMAALAQVYHYVIVDLPPVTVVTDAITVSPLLDGMVLIVRRDYCDRVSLQNAMNQLELAGAKMLGVVFNGADGPNGSGTYYKKNKKYKYYKGKDYGYGYGYGYDREND